MNAPKLEELLDLPAKSLHTLAEAFADGPLRSSLSAGLLAPLVGGSADRAAMVLKSLRDRGCPPSDILTFGRSAPLSRKRNEPS